MSTQHSSEGQTTVEDLRGAGLAPEFLIFVLGLIRELHMVDLVSVGDTDGFINAAYEKWKRRGEDVCCGDSSIESTRRHGKGDRELVREGKEPCRDCLHRQRKRRAAS